MVYDCCYFAFENLEGIWKRACRSACACDGVVRREDVQLRFTLRREQSGESSEQKENAANCDERKHDLFLSFSEAEYFLLAPLCSLLTALPSLLIHTNPNQIAKNPQIA